jgi:hypothetical protein
MLGAFRVLTLLRRWCAYITFKEIGTKTKKGLEEFSMRKEKHNKYIFTKSLINL